MFDTHALSAEFPQLRRRIHGRRIVYLDSTATSLKPKQVIAAERRYYTRYTANVFRGIYTTSEEATALYEQARVDTASFLHANSADEVIFTRNTTESINLVAYAFVARCFSAGDRILTTIAEHHSNFVPWQQLAMQRQLGFDVVGLTADGDIDEENVAQKMTKKTRLVAITAASNVLGTIVPVSRIVSLVKSINPACLVLVDAAQAAPHMPVDVSIWGADFVAFSSHKMLGPTGVGVLWVKQERFDELSPFLYGGEMIQAVHVDSTEFKKPPHLFEAGTPHIAGVIGFGEAIRYLSRLGMKNVRAHEEQLVTYALNQLSKVPFVHVLGPKDPKKRGGVFAFTMDGVHPHDIAEVLNADTVFVRAGNHCAMPLHESLGIRATARASVYIYSTTEDIDAWISSLHRVKSVFS